MDVRTDYLVIGGGIAGLTFARKVAAGGASVVVLTKAGLTDSATHYAQGGVAAVLGATDSLQRHVDDTLDAGAGLCDRKVVEDIVGDGPGLVHELIELGVAFTRRDDGSLDLTREGGHTARRVVHAGDITGREVLRALVVGAQAHGNIEIRQRHVAVDLLTVARHGRGGRSDACLGAYVLDSATGRVGTYRAKATILATGGAGKAYLYTSNPNIASGDGVAMAYRAGLPIGNMEFFQFHPTLLYHPYAGSFLISEALRGEGGILKTLAGETFAEKYDERGSLAPRDIVARAIDAEMKRSGDESVTLDMTHLDHDFLVERFPNIHARCLELGIDMRERPIPVVPAAHYLCGGVVAAVDGATGLPGLYALGEVSCTGLHGANRLASNSLLEGLVMAHRAATHASRYVANGGATASTEVPDWDVGYATPSDEQVVVTQNWDELRRFMWNYVGIVRSDRRLARARRRVEFLQGEIREYYWQSTVDKNIIELRNLATVANLIVESAIRRRESRGLHYNLDCPERNDERWGFPTLVRRGEPGMFD